MIEGVEIPGKSRKKKWKIATQTSKERDVF